MPDRYRLIGAQLVLIAGVGLRLYRIADYTTFQGDQGLDALVVKRLLVDHFLPLEGPATSAGGVHLGPFYDYLLAPPMLVDWLDPFADAVFMAVLGALACGIVYLVASDWFGRPAGVVAGGLFAISPAAIVASRSAWNPAPAPFFVALAFGGIALWRRTTDARWLVLVGAALGCVIQFHYFSLGIVLAIGGVVLGEVLRERRNGAWALAGAAAFLVLLLPLVVHELTSGFPNLHAAAGLSSAEFATHDSLPRRLYAVLALLLVGPNLAGGIEPLAVLVTVLIVGALVFGLLTARLRFSAAPEFGVPTQRLRLVAPMAPGVLTQRQRFASAVLAATLGAPLVLAALYRGPVFEHYLIAYSPALFLGVGAAVAAARRWPAAGLVTMLAIGAVDVLHLPFGAPEQQLGRTAAAAQEIAAAANGQPFALWLIAVDDSDYAYRFQLERLGIHASDPGQAPPRTLFVLCQSGPCSLSDVRGTIGPEWTGAQVDFLPAVDGLEIARVSAAHAFDQE